MIKERNPTECHSPWRERCDRAQIILDSLQAGEHGEEDVCERLLGFAQDSKWEVRQVVAEAVCHVPEEWAFRLAAQFKNECNAYVKGELNRSLDRRRKTRRETTLLEDASDRYTGRMDRLRRQYGPEAAEAAHEVGQQRYSILAGAIAHDIRSILTHMKSSASTLSRGLRNGAQTSVLSRKAGSVLDGLDLLERCVVDIERYTQPMPAERRIEDIEEVVRFASEMTRQNLEDLGYDPCNVTLRITVPSGIRVRASRHLLVLALANLLKNAHESFMVAPSELGRGEIDLRVTADRNEIQVAIKDNGMGMSPENLRDLCAFVTERRNKAKVKSTGFGVPIAHRYIEAHGGTLKYESEEDVGTTVLITLPRTCQENRNE